MKREAKELNNLIEQVSQKVVDKVVNEKYLVSRMAVIVNEFDPNTNSASIIVPTDLSNHTDYKYPNRTGMTSLRSTVWENGQIKTYGDKVYLVYQSNNISQGWLESNKSLDIVKEVSRDYLTKADAANTYETKANASATYETKANASATYETKANASATYETKTNASATYETKANASATYETKTNASATYETKANASATYETKANASATYETKTNASNTYVKKSGGTMTGQLLTSFKSSVAMGSYGTSTTTIPALMNEVRYSSGCMGSITVNTAYTLNGITIPTGWYNFIYTPHRSGGNSGQASGDNHLYGNLLLFGMNNSNGMYRIRYSNGIGEVERFLFSGTIIARSTARTIAATTNHFYKVVLSSTLVSGHSEVFSITNGGIKVAFAGKYKVSASCYFQSGTSGSMPSVYIRTNNNADISASSSSASGMGTEKVAVSIPATTQSLPVVASPMLIDLARNDIVYLVGRSRQANGNIVCNNNMTYLQIEFLG